MSSPDSAPAVIETKLRVPSPRPEQVLRPRLLGMLEEGLDCRVTLVSAPAGYGKTILLSRWLRSREADGVFAWVSLDEQDGDPIRLWRHIVESLGRGAQGDEFGAAILAALSVAGAEVSGTVLPTLVNVLGEVPQRVLLVLDDYQFAAGGGPRGDGLLRRAPPGERAPRPRDPLRPAPSCSPTAETREKAAALPSPPNFCRENSAHGRPLPAYPAGVGRGASVPRPRADPPGLSSGASRPCGIRTHKPTRIGLPASA
jgi:hypothetical protein